MNQSEIHKIHLAVAIIMKFDIPKMYMLEAFEIINRIFIPKFE